MMLCTSCNSNKEQRQDFDNCELPCPLCNDVRKISFHRYVQWQMGWCPLFVGGFGKEYEQHLLRCYEQCCKEYHKKGRIKFVPFDFTGIHIDATGNERKNGSNINFDILFHYCKQLKCNDAPKQFR
jgi:hypothetical protein